VSDRKNFTPGRNWKYVILFGAIAVILIAMCFAPPISQNENYHHFADTRSLGTIPNILNVLSNVFFVVVGVLGMTLVLRDQNSLRLPLFIDVAEKWPYFIFFLGVTLTTFGSGYYHADPNDARLVWDRLPMTLGFMSLLSATIAERISVRSGLRSLAPLLIFGVASVVYWNFTQTPGRGDLRPYVLAQFGSLVVLVLLIGLFPPRYREATISSSRWEYMLWQKDLNPPTVISTTSAASSAGTP